MPSLINKLERVWTRHSNVVCIKTGFKIQTKNQRNHKRNLRIPVSNRTVSYS